MRVFNIYAKTVSSNNDQATIRNDFHAEQFDQRCDACFSDRELIQWMQPRF